MSKKIAVIIGSLRKDSYNRKLFETYKELSKDKFEFVEIEIATLPHYNGDLEAAGECKDLLSEIENKLTNSQAVIFFSPEYNYSIPGFLKNGIDWISRIKPQPLSNKKAAILGASPGKIGTGRMQYHFRQVAVALNLVMLNRPEVMVSGVNQLFDESGKLLDEKTKEFLKKHIEAFNEFME